MSNNPINDRAVVPVDFDRGTLTKRELIAAMVLQGILAGPMLYKTSESRVEKAVEYADLLIEELKVK